MDVDDGFDRLVEIRGMKKIVAYDQRTAATPYRNVFATFRRGQKSQFAAHGDILFSHVADDSSLLNQRCGTDRPLLGENRKPHDRIHRIAFGGNPHQRIFALFQKGFFRSKSNEGAPLIACSAKTTRSAPSAFARRTDSMILFVFPATSPTV